MWINGKGAEIAPFLNKNFHNNSEELVMLNVIIFMMVFVLARKIILQYSNKIGKEKIEESSKEIGIETFVMLLLAISHYILPLQLKTHIEHSWFTSIIEAIFFANTIVMVEMDIKYQEVYDLFHFINIASMILFIGYAGFPKNYISFLFFAALQLGIFQFMYGQADAFLFCECAAFLMLHNAEIEDYMWHMGIMLIFLAVAQGAKKNINKQGNLKHPVAMTPYIAASFLIFFI